MECEERQTHLKQEMSRSMILSNPKSERHHSRRSHSIIPRRSEPENTMDGEGVSNEKTSTSKHFALCGCKLHLSFLPRGSLLRILHGKTTKLDWRRRIHVAMDIARGMNYLHHRNPPVIHCDFRSSNLTRKIPWDHLNSVQVVEAIGFMGHRLEIPKDVDPEWVPKIESCWLRAVPPQERIINENLREKLRLICGTTSKRVGTLFSARLFNSEVQFGHAVKIRVMQVSLCL